jgi:hypothetical protein
MIGEIVLYSPYNADGDRLDKLEATVKKVAQELGIPYRGPIYREDNRVCVYYEDSDVKVYIYVDDPEREVNYDKVEMTIRVMSSIALKKHLFSKIKVR